ncbi:hypothetical protein GQ42DRAFT_162823 [Ramicandelaber brevisporus]|nr:hypothetical protein GQ42DRAFT_162823 [Ramicandelaber brevisporus]
MNTSSAAAVSPAILQHLLSYLDERSLDSLCQAVHRYALSLAIVDRARCEALFGGLLGPGLVSQVSALERLALDILKAISKNTSEPLLANASALWRCIAFASNAHNAQLASDQFVAIINAAQQNTRDSVVRGCLAVLMADPALHDIVSGKADSEDEADTATTRLRLVEALIKCCVVHPPMLQLCDQSGLFDRVLADASGDDILVVLSTLDLIIPLCEITGTVNGISILRQHGVFKAQKKRLETPDEDLLPFDDLGKAGAARFFARVIASPVSHLGAQEIVSETNFFTHVAEMLESADYPDLRIAAIDAIGIAGGSPQGLTLLLQAGNPAMSAFMKDIVPRATSGQLQVDVYRTLARMFDIDIPVASLVKDVEDAQLKLFNSLGRSNLLDTVVKAAAGIFRESVMASLVLLRALVTHSFGRKALLTQIPTAWLFLLDRNATLSHESTLLKYDIIKTVSEATRNQTGDSSTDERVDAGTLARIHVYVRQGPYYTEPQATVAEEHL